MPAIMSILGWKVQGLRCPDHSINCADGDGKPFPITLIQMPNGTGKTTTLELLRAALSGVATESTWNPEKISGFRKRDSDKPCGFFEVALLLNSERTTIRMSFDFENGRVSYETTGDQGKKDGFNPPLGFQRFMNENFVKFYVFNGELAQHLLDKEHIDAGIVVENLFQMKIFDTMAEKVLAHWSQMTKNVTAKEERGLSRRRNVLAELQAQRKAVEEEKKTREDEHASLTKRLQKKEASFRQEIEKVDARKQKFNKAELEVARLESEVKKEALDVLEQMRDPHALSPSFAHSMLALKNGLDCVKLPESTAREFFEDLAREDKCVCGRSINPEIATTIRTRASQYLDSEAVSLLNSMKTAIRDGVGEIPDDSDEGLIKGIESLGTVVVEERKARNYLDLLKLEAEQTDPDVKIAGNEINNLRAQIKEVAAKLEKFNSEDQPSDYKYIYNIKILDKKIEKAKADVAEITRTVTARKKCDVLRAILHSAHKKARNGITTELRDEANTRISELMPSNNISIDRIEEKLVLKGQEGGSAGETLSIAYAFLATLFHRSDHQLPFVVDSPAGPIDLTVRRKIGELIPKLARTGTGQFIAFTITTERDGFIEPLKRASNAEVCFITLFNKSLESAMLQLEAYGKREVIETLDGLIVAGEEFFNEFQFSEEEDA